MGKFRRGGWVLFLKKPYKIEKKFSENAYAVKMSYIHPLTSKMAVS